MRTLTDAKHWTSPQRTMMRKAARVHLLRWGGGLAMCLIVGLGIQQWLSALQRTSLQEQVVTAVDTVQNVRGAAIPFAIRDLRERYPAEMVTTELVTRFETEKDAHRKPGLAFALADYGIVHAEFLVSLIESLPGEDSGNIVHALRADREGSLKVLASAAAICTEQENWRLKARLAAAALGCGAPEIAADICQMDDRPDPIQRTIFIDQFPQWHGDLLILSQVTRTINDAALRSVLCLAVGSVPSEQVTQDERDAWVELFSDWYQHQRDIGTHSASGWALRHWEIPLPSLPVGEPERNKEQDEEVAKLAANVADLQQQLAEAEKAFPERQAAWNQQLRSQLASIAVIDGIQGFLCSSGLQAVVTTDFYDGKKQELMLLHDLETGQRRVLCELGWDFVVSPGSNGLIAMKPNLRNPPQKEVHLFDPGTGAIRSVGLGVCPSWDMNGTTLYFHDVTSQIVMSLNVNDAETVPEPLIGEIPPSFVVVSPDATKVAFFLSDEIRVIDIATHKMIARYTTSAWRGALLGWAPDSRHVGFGSHVVASGLWILDTETGECFMAVPGSATRPSWSRDGRRMLYECRIDNKIHVVAWSPEEQQALAEMNRGRVELTESIRQLQDRLTETNAMLSEAGWQRTCQWYVNREGITMLCIPAGQFLNESGATVEVKTGFLLSDREISVGQFQQFMDDQDYPHREKPSDWASTDKEDSPTSDHPVAQVSWYDSALYCNWLSAREGLAPAYERTGAKGRIGETEYDVWKLVEGGSGYRLPHEIEWEYACRAGTTTDFASGNDEEMLRSYAVISPSGTEIGAGKLPNSWGLYDLHGNVWEWCDDGVLRGGSFSVRASNVRSSNRNSGQQDLRVNNVGFRVARTLPPVPLALLSPVEGESKPEN
jgi:formylglycine-generating enzyme required for sulfatase activity